MQAGASGYVLKQSASAELIRAIHSVSGGIAYVDPSVRTTERARDPWADQADEASAHEPLLPLEEQVLRLLAASYSNEEMAAHLSLDLEAIAGARVGAMRKVGVTTRFAVIRYAQARGWLPSASAVQAWRSACKSEQMPSMPLTPTPSAELDAQGRGYPRPVLRRATWFSLNGDWDFAFDPEGVWQDPTDARWDSRIRVPFAPEAPASGIGRTGFFRTCWYRQHCELPEMPSDGRWILHFGAVDWQATVWVNGAFAGGHDGRYTPFSMDVTDLADGSACEIVVRADDDPHDLAKPRGKQDWQLEPHSIWYPRRLVSGRRFGSNMFRRRALAA